MLNKKSDIKIIFDKLDNNQYISRNDIKLLSSIRKNITNEQELFNLKKSRKSLYNSLLIIPPKPHPPLILYKSTKIQNKKNKKKIYINLNKYNKQNFILKGGRISRTYCKNIENRFESILTPHFSSAASAASAASATSATSSSSKKSRKILYYYLIVLLEKILEIKHDFYNTRDALAGVSRWETIYDNTKSFQAKVNNLCGPGMKVRLSSYFKKFQQIKLYIGICFYLMMI